MDTWDIYTKQRMADVDPINHILHQPLKETYTFKEDHFKVTSELKKQVEHYVLGHFKAGLRDGPMSHRWRLVCKTFLHWPTFKDTDFRNPIVLVHEKNQYRIMTGITRLWAKCFNDPSYTATKALIFHRNRFFRGNQITSLDQAQELFVDPVDQLLISVDYYAPSKCYFVNEFDTLDREHMQLFLGQTDSVKDEYTDIWDAFYRIATTQNITLGSDRHIFTACEQMFRSA